MRKMKIVKTFTFVNANGAKLHLNLGIVTDGLHDEMPCSNADKGFRWCFVGENIPMPVRSGYWFNGMPEHIMLDWLKANGWALHITVNMTYGRARIYELPKGNEEPVKTCELSDTALRSGRDALKDAIKMLCDNGYILKSVSLYRYVHHCDLVEAKNAVDAIRLDTNT